jgi:hypothetical protein
MARTPVALLVTLALALLAAPLGGEAQPSARVFRIDWLSIASPRPEILRRTEAFTHGLRDLGYVEDQNLAVEYRYAEGRSDSEPKQPRPGEAAPLC